MPNIAKMENWNGAAVSQERRDEAAQRIFNLLNASSLPKDRTSILTGDMLVMGEKYTLVDGTVHITIADTYIRRRTSYLTSGDIAF
jgi:hypothetical protein